MWTSPYYTSVVDTTLCGHYNTIRLGRHCKVLIILYFKTLPGWTLKVWSLLGNTTVWTLHYADNTLLYNSVDTTLYKHYTVQTLLGNTHMGTLYCADNTLLYNSADTTLYEYFIVRTLLANTTVWTVYYAETSPCTTVWTLHYIMVQLTVYVSVSGLPVLTILYRLIGMHKRTKS